MAHPAVRVARRFPWKFFLTAVLIAVFGSAGAVFGLVQWLRRDLPTPEQVSSIQAPIKTTVFDVRGRVLHEFYRENRSSVPLKRIPSAIPRAAEIEVLACPAPKWSYSLSERYVNPLNPPI